MKTYTCINIVRNENGRIMGYQLVDEHNSVITIKAQELKQSLRNKEISLTNLKLTKSNRLISCKNRLIDIILDNDASLKRYLGKARLLGVCKIIHTVDGAESLLVRVEPYQYILYIPDNVEILNNATKDFVQALNDEDAEEIRELYVVGGRGLKDIKGLFSLHKFKVLDLTRLHTSNVVTMANLFERSIVPYLDLRSFDTRKVVNMSSMFSNCVTDKIELSSFNTTKVTFMCNMFRNCTVPHLDLSSFCTHSVTTMEAMFYGCHLGKLDLSNFDTHYVNSMRHMFEQFQAEELIQHFDTENVHDMIFMFFNSTIPQIDISHFYRSFRVKRDGMFQFCEADIVRVNKDEVELIEQIRRDSLIAQIIPVDKSVEKFRIGKCK